MQYIFNKKSGKNNFNRLNKVKMIQHLLEIDGFKNLILYTDFCTIMIKFEHTKVEYSLDWKFIDKLETQEQLLNYVNKVENSIKKLNDNFIKICESE